jgi:hypothetical protein
MLAAALLVGTVLAIAASSSDALAALGDGICPPRPCPGSAAPHELAVVGETLYFVATDDVHGFELWST